MAGNCRIGKGEGQWCESRGATANTRFRSRSRSGSGSGSGLGSGCESAAGVKRKFGISPKPGWNGEARERLILMEPLTECASVGVRSQGVGVLRLLALSQGNGDGRNESPVCVGRMARAQNGLPVDLLWVASVALSLARSTR